MKNKTATSVTPHIMRQIPQLSQLDRLKRLRCKIHFDMLHIMTNNLNELNLNNYVQLYSFSSFPYRICYKYKSLTGIPFSLLSDPRNQDTLFYQIQVNPKEFDSLGSLKQFIEGLMGCELTDENHKIQRLDIAFTVSAAIFSPTLVFRCGRFKWKNRARTYISNEYGNGDMTGSRTTSKSMNFSCYDRGLLIRYKHRNGRRKIRFEIQIKGASIDSLRIRKFSNLYDFDIKMVLNRFNFYDIRYLRSSLKNKLKKFEAFQHDCAHLGFQIARMNLNKNRAFYRDIEKYIEPLSIDNGKKPISVCFFRSFKSWSKKWCK